MVNAASTLLSPFGYNWPTIVEIFGLKKPFPMMSKVSVKGSDMCVVYQFLTQKAKNGLKDSEVEWNFQKYLLNEKGELVDVISPRTLPTDSKIVNWIKS
jgi:glutathione peroxidase